MRFLLLKNKISTHLADIFNIFFSSGVFPSILKIAKVIPVHIKNQSCFAQIIGHSLYYPTLIKSLKKSCIIESISFLIETTLYIPFSLAFGSIIQLHMLC